jgi:maleylacetoacetate isomerase
LLKSEQRSPQYLQNVNPLGTVPVLVTSKGDVIWQSLAIIDYVDEGRKLLPVDPMDRVRCMQIVNTICSEIQPLQNLSVINRVAEIAGGGETGERVKREWALDHNRRKLGILEKLIIRSEGPYCVDSGISLADICLVPQLYSARRFGLDLDSEFPKLMKVARSLERLPEFEAAHAHAQFDCPETIRAEGVYF